MTKSLIIPVAGKSSRYPGMRPKWLLTMPDGKLMLEKSIELFEPKFKRNFRARDSRVSWCLH